MGVACVVVAAGKGRRLGSKIRKPYVKLGNKPILAHSLASLNKNTRIESIVLVVAGDDLNYARSFIKKYAFGKVKHITSGGRTRFHSVRNGLRRIEKDERIDIVLIHDGARPFLEKKIISDVIKTSEKFGSAVCAVPVKPTVKKVGSNLVIKATPDRKSLWEAQTPQGFKKKIILKAYGLGEDEFRRNPSLKNATDDASLVEKRGYKVRAVMGSYRNIKITTLEDLKIAKVLLKNRS